MFVIQVLCTAFCVIFGIDRMVDGAVSAEVATGLGFVLVGLGILVVAMLDAEKPWWQGYY